MNELTVRLSNASRDETTGVEGDGMELATWLVGTDFNCNDMDDLTLDDYVTAMSN